MAHDEELSQLPGPNFPVRLFEAKIDLSKIFDLSGLSGVDSTRFFMPGLVKMAQQYC